MIERMRVVIAPRVCQLFRMGVDDTAGGSEEMR